MARIAGINEDEFSGLMNNRPYLEGIVKIAQDGYDRFAISSTPTFVINDKDIIAGYKPYDEFEADLNGLMT
jgi:predicted DsbA family dithiol-disulfide isomerase